MNVRVEALFDGPAGSFWCHEKFGHAEYEQAQAFTQLCLRGGAKFVWVVGPELDDDGFARTDLEADGVDVFDERDADRRWELYGEAS